MRRNMADHVIKHGREKKIQHPTVMVVDEEFLNISLGHMDSQIFLITQMEE